MTNGDEMGRLRASLLGGRWADLHSPLLDLLLLDDPGCWRDIREACCLRIMSLVGRMTGRDWPPVLGLVVQFDGDPKMYDPGQPATVRRLLAPMPDLLAEMEDTLAILERYPT